MVVEPFAFVTALIKLRTIETTDKAIIRLIVDPLLEFFPQRPKSVDDDTFLYFELNTLNHVQQDEH
jgi:hypothetical protein